MRIIIDPGHGVEIVEGEIFSEDGECGQILQADGSFITPDVTDAEKSEIIASVNIQ